MFSVRFCLQCCFVMFSERFCLVFRAVLLCFHSGFVMFSVRFCYVFGAVLFTERFCYVFRVVLLCLQSSFVVFSERFCCVFRAVLLCFPSGFIVFSVRCQDPEIVDEIWPEVKRVGRTARLNCTVVNKQNNVVSGHTERGNV